MIGHARFRYVAISLALAGAVGAALTPRSTVVAQDTSATAVPSNIQAVLDKARYKGGVWGLRVMDGDKVLIDLNSQRKFYIGSVRKVFSIGQLLNAVGPNHTYDTPIYRTGTIDGGGVLHGNLIVVASGDLTMGGRLNPDGTIAVSDWDHNEADGLGNAILTKPNPLAGYARLAQAIRAAGIKRVAGNVVIDDRLFKPWFFRDQFNVRPIFVNDDVVDMTIVPGGKTGATANLTSRPVSSALQIVNKLRVGAANSKDTLKIDPELPSCIGNPACASTITGSLPSDFKPPLTGKPTLVQTVRIVQPSNYARTVLIEQLRAAGVTVAAPTVQQNPVALLPAWGSYRVANRVAQLTGMRYGQDAKFVLKISYNIGADTSLVLLGTKYGANSMPAALAWERKDLAAHWNVNADQYHFIDGSGGGETTATNIAVTTMLEELAKSPAAAAFEDALPSLGVDGSLAFVKDFTKDPTLAGALAKVHAKTGTYVGAGPTGGMELKAQALGGYINTKSGRHLTFELTINNIPIKEILDITNVFQDEGTVAAILWRDY
ncbi:MAG TPA: D-alanyl-D-alanine carboxypeptidase [Candidatus Tumulicola sp.]|jgi:D-alanyl-D-alanine carboxypeptidase/D-alanyl-D-alanine-endopeptidase (penicillin-binding protein 4)